MASHTVDDIIDGHVSYFLPSRVHCSAQILFRMCLVKLTFEEGPLVVDRRDIRLPHNEAFWSSIGYWDFEIRRVAEMEQRVRGNYISAHTTGSTKLVDVSLRCQNTAMCTRLTRCPNTTSPPSLMTDEEREWQSMISDVKWCCPGSRLTPFTVIIFP